MQKKEVKKEKSEDETTFNASDTDVDTDTEIEAVKNAKRIKTSATSQDDDSKKPADDEESVLVEVPKLTRSRSKEMSRKPRCKFWDKCFRKNRDHLAEFAHPHDVLKADAAKTAGASTSAAMEVDDKCPEPLHQLDNNDKVKVTGGLRGEHTYTIAKFEGNYTCT